MRADVSLSPGPARSPSLLRTAHGRAAAPRSADATAAIERVPPDAALTESQLASIWRGQRFPPGALVTRDGVPVRVIFRGRPGRGPGPDFRSAVIAGPSGIPLRGDVELHVRSSSFRAHGHHLDPAYAGVVLHVVFDDDAAEDAPLPGGGSAPVVALSAWVSERAGELARWLEQPVLWREPCHEAITRRGIDGVAAELEREGDRRLHMKVERMRGWADASGAEQALYEALFEALGYGGNSPPMGALARIAPWRNVAAHAGARSDRRRQLEALLLGSAGLLPSRRRHRGPVDRYVEELEGRFAEAQLPSLDPGIWKLWGVRPENAPARRIAGAAALLARAGSPDALSGAGSMAETAAAVSALAVEASGYWRTHHDVCAAPCRLPAALIGRSRALEIIVNVLVPFACAAGDASAGERALALYARLPRPARYGATGFIEEYIASAGIRVPVNARRAQGLLALNRDWCTQGGCGRCPLS